MNETEGIERAISDIMEYASQVGMIWIIIGAFLFFVSLFIWYLEKIIIQRRDSHV